MTEKYATVPQAGTPLTSQPPKSFEAFGKIHCGYFIFNINKY